MAAESQYNWAEEIEKFHRTKAGVKGLVDSGIKKIPKFFISQPEISPSPPPSTEATDLQIPLIDLSGADAGGPRRAEVVDEIRKAAESWGFFQIVNHGVSLGTMKGVLEGTRGFHEQPKEAKMDLYSSDGSRKVRFFTINGDKFHESHVASWRDVLGCSFPDDVLDSEAIPLVCRKEILQYVKSMSTLRQVLAELLSEALGLSSNFLSQMECLKSQYLTCLYYPVCPEPDLAIGTVKHSDATFLTILVQDNCGGLQFLHQNRWVDVPPVPGALIANMGDLMQIITNDKFKSPEHRVLARTAGARVSAACFFFPSIGKIFQSYGPIKELTSKKDPPVYKEVPYLEYIAYFQENVRTRTSALPHFKL